MSNINVTHNGEYKVPPSNLDCWAFRDICEEARQWLQAIITKKDPFIRQSLTMIERVLYHMWCLEYDIVKGDAVWFNYHEIFAVACVEVVGMCEDREIMEMFFHAWFVGEAYHVQPPFSREELIQQAIEASERWTQAYNCFLSGRSDWHTSKPAPCDRNDVLLSQRKGDA